MAKILGKNTVVHISTRDLSKMTAKEINAALDAAAAKESKKEDNANYLGFEILAAKGLSVENTADTIDTSDFASMQESGGYKAEVPTSKTGGVSFDIDASDDDKSYTELKKNFENDIPFFIRIIPNYSYKKVVEDIDIEKDFEIRFVMISSMSGTFDLAGTVSRSVSLVLTNLISGVYVVKEVKGL